MFGKRLKSLEEMEHFLLHERVRKVEIFENIVGSKENNIVDILDVVAEIKEMTGCTLVELRDKLKDGYKLVDVKSNWNLSSQDGE